MATLTIPNTFQLTHEQFAQLARVNRDVRLERTATGELIIMPPTGNITGNRNLDIEGQLWLDFVVELRSPGRSSQAITREDAGIFGKWHPVRIF